MRGSRVASAIGTNHGSSAALHIPAPKIRFRSNICGGKLYFTCRPLLARVETLPTHVCEHISTHYYPPPRSPQTPNLSRSNYLQFKPRWHIVTDAAATATCSLAGNSTSAHFNYTLVYHRHTYYDCNIYPVSQNVYGQQRLASKTTSTYDCSSCRRLMIVCTFDRSSNCNVPGTYLG